ncbi:hypothetical protein A374_17954 [Fictibacillus macauensis ZFHKF-1]|uniref:Transcription regulator TrmB N-terminal domain-containing protein n=1 Tax=Fictibacillus macauensis ZFHKF-1 TaxID=1196324 RepID=I8AF22_9BACL|nr:helix-turn-helix domain-containing protein [Fictibacillus macauensis]EIT83944.1 hypothetical protein A374_17954 [Fictibacillus macauensis ZFHKF-1]
MHQSLKKLGMTDLEGKCYVVLHETPRLSGYEVAKRVGASRPNVYSAIRSLLTKNACRVIEGEHAKYEAVPIADVLERYKEEFLETEQTLLAHLKEQKAQAPVFYHWEEEAHVQRIIHKAVRSAQTTLVLTVWAQDLPPLEAELVAAQDRGVTVIVQVIGSCVSALQHVYFRNEEDDWHSTERKFSVLCDERTAIIGSFGGELVPAAVESQHPALIETLKNSFYQDMILKQIEYDFNEELEEAYGENYERLLYHMMYEIGLKI